jgi:hypothetical protein
MSCAESHKEVAGLRQLQPRLRKYSVTVVMLKLIFAAYRVRKVSSSQQRCCVVSIKV